MTAMDIFLLIYGWLLTCGGAAALGWLLGARPRQASEPGPVAVSAGRSYEDRVRALLDAPEWKGGDQPW